MFYRCTYPDGRIVLSAEIQGWSDTPVSAPTWIDARKVMDTSGMTYVPGHGWYWESTVT